MPKLLHVGIHNSKNKNAGDTVLFPVVRALFDSQLGDCFWDHRQLWDSFAIDDALAANEKYDGIVIGGGGLLLRDQVGSDTANSGWQWNSEIAAVEALRIPIFFFAVGYNRFRGQEDFDPIFSEHISATLRASKFFGLRNHGSIAAVKKYVSEDLGQRICLQQCPTTVLWQLYPAVRMKLENRVPNSRPILALNTAFDRETLRYGDAKKASLNILARSMKRAEDKGWHIHVVAHKTNDLEVVHHLVKEGVSFEAFDLTDAEYKDVINYYIQPDLVVGMRGHAQMIPFGLRRPIFSIISHDKMRYFLEDIGHPDWGCNINDPRFGETLDAFIDQAFIQAEPLARAVTAAQALCWENTMKNMGTISRSLS